MRKATVKLEIIAFTSLLLFISLIQTAYSSPLALTLSTASEEYTIGEEITLNGTLTLNEAPVSDGLVTVQINKPGDSLWVLRTRPSGTNTTTRTWPLQINEATLYSGTSARRGYHVGFNVTVENTVAVERNFTLFLNIFYSNSVPFAITEMGNFTIGPMDTNRIISSSVLTIPSDAPLGDATAYFNILDDLPSNGGFAYGPERALEFTITDGAGGDPAPPVEEPEQTEGVYVLKLRTPDAYAKLGNYTVYARTFYIPFAAMQTCTFEVYLRGDITGPDGFPDGKCDMRDIARVARAFGSYPGQPNWDPVADLDGNGKVDIKDVAAVAKDFGKIGEL